MKTVIISASFFLILSIGLSQEITWDWQTTFGGTGSNHPIVLTQDHMNNSLVLGVFNGELILDTTVLNSGIADHYYLAKFNDFGDACWIKDLYYSGLSYAVDIDANLDNEIFVAGKEITNPLYGEGFIKVVKFNDQGAELSEIKTDTVRYSDITCLELDDSGSIYISGGYSYDFSIDTIDWVQNNGIDMFYIKLDTAGNVLFGRNAWISGMDGYGVYKMATDAFGNSVLGGAIAAVADFGNGVTLNPVGIAPFAVYYDAIGNAQWAKNGISNCQGELSDLDIYNGKVFTTGYYCEDLVFGDDTISAPSNLNMYFATFFIDGSLDTLFSLSSIGSNGDDQGVNITHDSFGNFYFTGGFGDTLIFGTDTLLEDTSFVSPDLIADDYMVGKYDSDHNPIAAYRLNNIENFFGWGDLYTNPAGDVYFVGVSLDTVNKSNTGQSYIAKKGSIAFGIPQEEYCFSRPLLKSYPNPVSDKITVKLTDRNDKISRYEIYNIDGKILSAGTADSSSTEISTGSLSDGNYIICVLSDKGNRFSVKFLKQ
ncbi:MAG: hypothetical protein A2W93_13100 [Bacteroidetes bacterium GWF2_43_63]|nr:MAG: hypothetical protein A2W94_03505 [Bacteroidetes bacterium GWE2_42_42]OFY55120.1 MAG: hypothetical protein A2W93_13100 [Bacteroidetes bacterium GWF2_43_63]HBG70261.1 hypothetical protein [Bacteroidales bacterium]HCB63067.1 hypothetical protein [Bacteroidales bacterium]HCY22714.1 hypothetical protein [Bacteroidales bacterium]